MRLRVYLNKIVVPCGVIIVVLAYVLYRSNMLYQDHHTDSYKSLIFYQANAMQLSDLPTNNILFGVQIYGSDDFRLQIAKSLWMLKMGDSDTFTRLTKCVGIIREESRTSANITNKPPHIGMSRRAAFTSLTWCAAGLAHEVRHIELAIERGDMRPYVVYNAGQIPKARGYRDFQREELECGVLTLKVMKRLGAPRSEIDYIRSQDGTHFDVNRDGKWDSEDERIEN